MSSELDKIVGQPQVIKNYGVLAKCNEEFTGLTDVHTNNIYNNQPELAINTDFYKDELCNRILWKFREYNDNTRTFINRLLSIEMQFRKNVDTESIRECSAIIANIFFSGDSQFIDYLRHVLVNQVLAKDRYIDNGKMFQFAFLVRDLYNILVSDENDYYNFISKHLCELFKKVKQILISNNLLA
jgi:hypothetical protein